MATSPKIVCVIASLGCGGAERVLSFLANAWVSSRAVTVLTFDDGAEPPFFEVDQRVAHRPLGLARISGSLAQGALNNVRRVFDLRAALRTEAPGVVLSFGDRTNVLALLAARPLGIPVVVSERVDPRSYDNGKIWGMMRSVTYRRAAAIVVQTQRTRRYLAGRWSAPLVVIPNPVATVEPVSLTDSTERLVLAMGRLEPQKGFDVLLRAFSTMSERHPGWRLAILGEGSSRAPLEALARELGIAARVEFPGRSRDPGRFLQSAAIFVLSSRFEGFPNALAEAMANGVAVIAADCPTGPRELVRSEVSGLLVPVDDVPAMAGALERLAADPELRRRLGSQAREAMRRYHPDAVLREWDRLFASVMVGGGPLDTEEIEAPIRDED